MSVKQHKILNRDGETIATAKAESLKKAIEKVVKRGVSLRRAELPGLDLEGLDLFNADLVGANLSKARLKGAKLNSADLQGAVLTGANLHGAQARRANFRASDCRSMRCAGATMSFANFSSADVSGADFSEGYLSSALFCSAQMESSSFKNATLNNTDFSGARLIRVSMKGVRADVTGPLNEGQMPNLTNGAIVIGGKYDDAKLADTLPAMKRDRGLGKAWRTAIYGAVAGGFMYAGANADAAIETFLNGQSLSGGMALAFAMPAALFVREMATEFFMNKAYSALRAAQLKVRDAIGELSTAIRNRRDLVVGVFDEGYQKPFEAALTTTIESIEDESSIGKFASFFSEIGHIIVCRKKNLDLAFQMIDHHIDGIRTFDHDLVLCRSDIEGEPREDVPAAVRFHKNGGTTMVWCKEGKPTHLVTYDVGGEAINQSSVDGAVFDAPDEHEQAIEFKSAILDSSGFGDIDYPIDSHRLVSGRDKSIQIRSKRTGRLDNPNGPAFVRPDGERFYFRNGQLKDADVEDLDLETATENRP